VEDKTGLPLIAPKIEGRILTFEVIHHKRHGSSELGPNVRFRVELTGENEAILHRLEHQPDAIKLTRRSWRDPSNRN